MPCLFLGVWTRAWRLDEGAIVWRQSDATECDRLFFFCVCVWLSFAVFVSVCGSKIPMKHADSECPLETRLEVWLSRS